MIKTCRNQTEDLLRECEIETFRSQRTRRSARQQDRKRGASQAPTSGVVVTFAAEREPSTETSAVPGRSFARRLRKLNYRAPKRVPTRVPASVKNRALEEKARRAKIKRCDQASNG